MALTYVVLPTPPGQGRAVVWVIEPLICGTGQSFFCIFFLFRPAVSPPIGAGGDLSILATPTVAQDCVTSCFPFFFGDIISPCSPSLRLWRYFGFPRFRRHILAPLPLADDMTVVFVYVLPVTCGYASFSFFFGVPCRFRRLAV